jgi:hypothetical protein
MGRGPLAGGVRAARRAAAGLAGLAVLVTGCGAGEHRARDGDRTPSSAIPAALLREARPIGRAFRFHPPARGPVIGVCQHGLGPRHGVHVEVFAANRVVLLPAGIGTRPPLRRAEGRIIAAACYGAPVTVEPTGVVLVRAGRALTLGAVFRSWGQPLSRRQLGSFRAEPGTTVPARPPALALHLPARSVRQPSAARVRWAVRGLRPR